MAPSSSTYGKIGKAEIERASRKPDRDLTDYDYYLRARGYIREDTHESLARARQIAEEGLARFPGSPALNLLMADASLLTEQTDLWAVRRLPREVCARLEIRQ